MDSFETIIIIYHFDNSEQIYNYRFLILAISALSQAFAVASPFLGLVEFSLLVSPQLSAGLRVGNVLVFGGGFKQGRSVSASHVSDSTLVVHFNFS